MPVAVAGLSLRLPGRDPTVVRVGPSLSVGGRPASASSNASSQAVLASTSTVLGAAPPPPYTAVPSTATGRLSGRSSARSRQDHRSRQDQTGSGRKNGGGGGRCKESAAAAVSHQRETSSLGHSHAAGGSPHPSIAAHSQCDVVDHRDTDSVANSSAGALTSSSFVCGLRRPTETNDDDDATVGHSHRRSSRQVLPLPAAAAAAMSVDDNASMTRSMTQRSDSYAAHSLASPDKGGPRPGGSNQHGSGIAGEASSQAGVEPRRRVGFAHMLGDDGGDDRGAGGTGGDGIIHHSHGHSHHHHWTASTIGGALPLPFPAPRQEIDYQRRLNATTLQNAAAVGSRASAQQLLDGAATTHHGYQVAAQDDDDPGRRSPILQDDRSPSDAGQSAAASATRDDYDDHRHRPTSMARDGLRLRFDRAVDRQVTPIVTTAAITNTVQAGGPGPTATRPPPTLTTAPSDHHATSSCSVAAWAAATAATTTPAMHAQEDASADTNGTLQPAALSLSSGSSLNSAHAQGLVIPSRSLLCPPADPVSDPSIQVVAPPVVPDPPEDPEAMAAAANPLTSAGCELQSSSSTGNVASSNSSSKRGRRKAKAAALQSLHRSASTADERPVRSPDTVSRSDLRSGGAARGSPAPVGGGGGHSSLSSSAAAFIATAARGENATEGTGSIASNGSSSRSRKSANRLKSQLLKKQKEDVEAFLIQQQQRAAPPTSLLAGTAVAEPCRRSSQVFSPPLPFHHHDAVALVDEEKKTQPRRAAADDDDDENDASQGVQYDVEDSAPPPPPPPLDALLHEALDAVIPTWSDVTERRVAAMTVAEHIHHVLEGYHSVTNGRGAHVRGTHPPRGTLGGGSSSSLKSVLASRDELPQHEQPPSGGSEYFNDTATTISNSDATSTTTTMAATSRTNYGLKWAVFGSVHSNTFLPDADVDLSVTLWRNVDAPPPLPRSSQEEGAAPPPPPRHDVPCSRAIADDALVYVGDHVHEVSHGEVSLETVVFAEVRLLKLLYQGVRNVDVTVDNCGSGMLTACFLHEVDRRFGHGHLFKRTLLLFKLWALNEARIMGAAGGYLGTYCTTVMLIAALNAAFEHNRRLRLRGGGGGGGCLHDEDDVVEVMTDPAALWWHRDRRRWSRPATALSSTPSDAANSDGDRWSAPRSAAGRNTTGNCGGRGGDTVAPAAASVSPDDSEEAASRLREAAATHSPNGGADDEADSSPITKESRNRTVARPPAAPLWAATTPPNLGSHTAGCGDGSGVFAAPLTSSHLLSLNRMSQQQQQQQPIGAGASVAAGGGASSAAAQPGAMGDHSAIGKRPPGDSQFSEGGKPPAAATKSKSTSTHRSGQRSDDAAGAVCDDGQRLGDLSDAAAVELEECCTLTSSCAPSAETAARKRQRRANVDSLAMRRVSLLINDDATRHEVSARRVWLGAYGGSDEAEEPSVAVGADIADDVAPLTTSRSPDMPHGLRAASVHLAAGGKDGVNPHPSKRPGKPTTSSMSEVTAGDEDEDLSAEPAAEPADEEEQEEEDPEDVCSAGANDATTADENVDDDEDRDRDLSDGEDDAGSDVTFGTTTVEGRGSVTTVSVLPSHHHRSTAHHGLSGGGAGGVTASATAATIPESRPRSAVSSVKDLPLGTGGASSHDDPRQAATDGCKAGVPRRSTLPLPPYNNGTEGARPSNGRLVAAGEVGSSLLRGLTAVEGSSSSQRHRSIAVESETAAMPTATTVLSDSGLESSPGPSAASRRAAAGYFDGTRPVPLTPAALFRFAVQYFSTVDVRTEAITAYGVFAIAELPALASTVTAQGASSHRFRHLVVNPAFVLDVKATYAGVAPRPDVAFSPTQPNGSSSSSHPHQTPPPEGDAALITTAAASGVDAAAAAFPIRYVNVVDPLRPRTGNLTRGVSRHNAARIHNAFLKGSLQFAQAMVGDLAPEEVIREIAAALPAMHQRAVTVPPPSMATLMSSSSALREALHSDPWTLGLSADHVLHHPACADAGCWSNHEAWGRPTVFCVDFDALACEAAELLHAPAPYPPPEVGGDHAAGGPSATSPVDATHHHLSPQELADAAAASLPFGIPPGNLYAAAAVQQAPPSFASPFAPPAAPMTVTVRGKRHPHPIIDAAPTTGPGGVRQRPTVDAPTPIDMDRHHLVHAEDDGSHHDGLMPLPPPPVGSDNSASPFDPHSGGGDLAAPFPTHVHTTTTAAAATMRHLASSTQPYGTPTPLFHGWTGYHPRQEDAVAASPQGSNYPPLATHPSIQHPSLHHHHHHGHHQPLAGYGPPPNGVAAQPYYPGGPFMATAPHPHHAAAYITPYGVSGGGSAHPHIMMMMMAPAAYAAAHGGMISMGAAPPDDPAAAETSLEGQGGGTPPRGQAGKARRAAQPQPQQPVARGGGGDAPSSATTPKRPSLPRGGNAAAAAGTLMGDGAIPTAPFAKGGRMDGGVAVAVPPSSGGAVGRSVARDERERREASAKLQAAPELPPA